MISDCVGAEVSVKGEFVELEVDEVDEVDVLLAVVVDREDEDDEGSKVVEADEKKPADDG